MKKLITPITAENFQDNWKIIDDERRIAKKKSVTTGIASFFSNMTLTILSLLAINGLIHDHFNGSFSAFLEEIPYLLPIWEKVSSYFLRQDQSWEIQVLLTALVVYGVSFLASGLFVLLVTALYHPFKTPLPESTPKDNAAKMLSVAKEARKFSNRTGSRSHAFWAFMFMVILFIQIALYAVMGTGTFESIIQFISNPIIKLLEPYMRSEQMLSNAVSSMLLPAIMASCMVVYLGYALIGLIHSLTVNFMYRYKIPYSFVAEAEYYHVFADEQAGELSPEDLHTQRIEKSNSWLEQAIEYEKICAYGKAKEFYAQAAHCENPEAMEHYARIWLIANAKDPAKYWLQKCVDTGSASETAVKNLRRLKWGRKVQARYIPENRE